LNHSEHGTLGQQFWAVSTLNETLSLNNTNRLVHPWA